MKIGPIPTRIFGIGMHKTATSSLNSALKILGFESTHWESPRHAKKIYEEVISGRSKTLERYYAASDLPITILYRELDEMYPGSKFILTIRDQDTWLTSVENHWNPKKNKWRETWDTDCFTNRIHQLVYGRKTFDRKVFLDKYLSHNVDVIKYFENRPDDLLVMGSPSWGLARFLNQPIPAQEYPRDLVTNANR
jgi:hypothetical protein